MARPFVNEIRENDHVRGIFLATRKSLLLTRTGTPYLSLTLADRTGEIEGRAWDDAERYDNEFDRGDYVEVSAVASAYNGKMQLKVESVDRVAPGSIDPRDFLPSSRFDTDVMWQELWDLIDGVADPFIRQLLQAFLDDEEIGPRLREAPAAKGVHHPFIGGLLEHTLSVIQLAHRIADHYPRANRDLLVAGAFLHDLGKVRELSWSGGLVDYTTEGRLVGHLLITVQWIHEKASRIPNFPPELEMHLVHLVAAHHGQLEYGSPKVPHTLEAMLVHALDELDSRVQSWTMIMDRDSGEEWTGYQRLYERYLFKGPGWRGERLGHGPAPEGRRWEGESLYRREANGEPVVTKGSTDEEKPKGTARQVPTPPLFADDVGAPVKREVKTPPVAPSEPSTGVEPELQPSLLSTGVEPSAPDAAPVQDVGPPKKSPSRKGRSFAEEVKGSGASSRKTTQEPPSMPDLFSLPRRTR